MKKQKTYYERTDYVIGFLKSTVTLLVCLTFLLTFSF